MIKEAYIPLDSVHAAKLLVILPTYQNFKYWSLNHHMRQASRGCGRLTTSNVLVAITTAIVVTGIHNVINIYSAPDLEPGAIPSWHHSVSQKSPLQPELFPKDLGEKLPEVRQNAHLNGSMRNISHRIDLFSCPPNHLRVAPKVNYLVGMGHKMTEVFYVFWYAMTRGHCFCFDTEHFGNDMEIYHLLLEPVFPSCQIHFPHRPLTETSVFKLEAQKPIQLTDAGAPIHWIYPDMGAVWPRALQEKMPLGHGDVLAFVDGFLRDNALVRDIIYPWYKKHKSIHHVFQKQDRLEANGTKLIGDPGDMKVLNGAFHVRVGDLILEASESYWRNVFQASTRVVELEHGPGYKIHIYWVYFQANFGGGAGDAMRKILAKNAEGEWPSDPQLLPKSHSFLYKLCGEFKSIECFWKSGTNILETIDLFVESDIVYVSGSSFSQVLALFNQGIRLQALPKEVNYFGTATKGSVPFLQASTGGLSSLRHYYIDGAGELFDEHYAFLRLNISNTSIVDTKSKNKS